MRRSTLTLACALLLPALAKADTFNFSILGSGGGYSGSGSLIATNNGDDSYTTTGITGTGVMDLLAPNEFFFNDNLLFPGASRLVDVAGLAFTAVAGGKSYSVNIFSSVAGYEALTLDADGEYSDVPVTFALVPAAAATPEPSSLSLLGLGALTLAGVIRRRLA